MVLDALDKFLLITIMFSFSLFLLVIFFQICRKNSVGKDIECVFLKKEYTNLIISALFLVMGIVDVLQYLYSWQKLLTILLAGINFIIAGLSLAVMFFLQKMYIGSKGIVFFRFPFVLKRQEIESFFWEHGNKLFVVKKNSKRYKFVITDDQKQRTDDLLRSKLLEH